MEKKRQQLFTQFQVLFLKNQHLQTAKTRLCVSAATLCLSLCVSDIMKVKKAQMCSVSIQCTDH